MIKNQFIYTRKVVIPGKNGEEAKTVTFKDSFNVNKVIRTVQVDDGYVVILDDFHEETRQVPILNKQSKPTGIKNERNTYQSEIRLSIEEGLKLLDIIGL